MTYRLFGLRPATVLWFSLLTRDPPPKWQCDRPGILSYVRPNATPTDVNQPTQQNFKSSLYKQTSFLIVTPAENHGKWQYWLYFEFAAEKFPTDQNLLGGFDVTSKAHQHFRWTHGKSRPTQKLLKEFVLSDLVVLSQENWCWHFSGKKRNRKRILSTNNLGCEWSMGYLHSSG